MKIKINNLYVTLFLAGLYGYLITLLPVLTSVDSISYLSYAVDSESELVRRFSVSTAQGFVNEPAWLLLNIGLSNLLNRNPESIVLFISFLAAFFSFYFVFKSSVTTRNIIIIFILMASPIFLSNFVSHLRGGVAMALFITAFMQKNKNIKAALLLVTPFIHISFVIVLCGYLLSIVSLKLRLSDSVYLLVSLVFASALTVFLVNFSSPDVRQTTSENSVNVSGVGFLFWLIYFFNVCFFSRRTFEYRAEIDRVIFLFSINMLLFYLCSYFVFYGAGRIMEVTFIFHVVSLFFIKNLGRAIGLSMIFFLNVFLWLTKLNEPNLGF